MGDGARLEQLVALVEGLRLPDGFQVQTNRRVVDESGIVIAELDVEIAGPVGSSTYRWLIECRDRPGTGPAPASWIEQLVGRRARFRYDKVMAVSTTGFSSGAKQLAREMAIDTRLIECLEPKEFSSWLSAQDLRQYIQTVRLLGGAIGLAEDVSDPHMAATLEVVRSITGNDPVLRSRKTGAMTSMAQALLGVVQANNLFEKAKPDGTPLRVRLRVQYTNDDDCFDLETAMGPVRANEIVFDGELVSRLTLVPFSGASSYRHVESGEVISDSVVYEIDAGKSVSLHRFADTGETVVVLKAPETSNADITITTATLRERHSE